VIKVSVLTLATLALVGCVQNTINMSSGSGRHELGPEEESAFTTSKDSQSSTDSIQELSSKISGIDKSQNEMTKTIQKTSETTQDMQDRDEAKDRLDPTLPKAQRQLLYKDAK
jgi:hypothetical protein